MHIFSKTTPPVPALGRSVFNDLTDDVGRDSTATNYISPAIITVSSARQFVAFTGLDGSSDWIYTLECRIKNGSGAVTAYTLRPNNIATDGVFQQLYLTGGAIGQAGGAGLRFAASLSSECHATVQYFCRLQNYMRQYTSKCIYESGIVHYGGEWETYSPWETNSLYIYASTATGIGIGSTFKLSVLPGRSGAV